MINTFMLTDRLKHVREIVDAVLYDVGSGMSGDEAVDKHFYSLIIGNTHLSVIIKDGVANRIEKES